MRVVAILVLALSVSGCSSETVYLQNAQGEQVMCRPYLGAPVNFSFTSSLRNCVEDFQEAGYERIQGPQ